MRKNSPCFGFLICGYKGNGKTYFGEEVLPSVLLSDNPSFDNKLITDRYDVYFSEEFVSPSLQRGSISEVQTLAFANALKDEFCKERCISRQFLESCKEYYRSELYHFSMKKRAEDNNYYTKKVVEEFLYFGDNACVIITDFRQPEEYIYLTQKFPSTIWITVEIQKGPPSTPVEMVPDTKSKRLPVIKEEDVMEGRLDLFTSDIILTRRFT